MGRSRKLVIAVSLTLTAVAALLYGDLILRAQSALDDHRAALREDLERLAVIRRPKPRLSETWEPARRTLLAVAAAASRTPELERMFSSCPFSFEDLQKLVHWDRTGTYPFDRTWPLAEHPFEVRHARPFRRTCPLSLEALLVQSVIAQELCLQGGLFMALMRSAWERNLHQDWEDLLSRPHFPRDDFAPAIRILDELDRARPPLYLHFLGEHVLQRLAVLRPRDSGDPDPVIRVAPGWRDLFSWGVLRARILQEYEDDFLKDAHFGDGHGPRGRWQRPLTDFGPDLFWFEANGIKDRKSRRNELLRLMAESPP